MLTQAAQNRFLSGLTIEDSSLLRGHLVPAELKAGNVLHRRGDRIDYIVFPHSGVAVSTGSSNGKAGTGIALIGRDEIAGGFAATASAPATCDCEVLISGRASRMPASAFRHALDRSPPLRHWAAQFDNALMAQAQQTALCNALHSVEARTCRWLIELQDRGAGDKIPLMQATLARLLGVRRTTITLVAGQLETAAVIKCHRGFMQVIDRPELERRSCECCFQVKSRSVAQLPPSTEPRGVPLQQARVR